MHRLSYANVTASVALFLALGGTSVAATNLVNGKNIKKGSIPADRVQAHTLGGLSSAALLASGAVKAGAADSQSPTVQTILDYPDLGLRIETDGNPDFDHSVMVRNTGSQPLLMPSVYGGVNLFPGKTFEWGTNNSPLTAGGGET